MDIIRAEPTPSKIACKALNPLGWTSVTTQASASKRPHERALDLARARSPAVLRLELNSSDGKGSGDGGKTDGSKGETGSGMGYVKSYYDDCEGSDDISGDKAKDDIIMRKHRKASF